MVLLQNSVTIDVDEKGSDNEDIAEIALIGDEEEDCSVCSCDDDGETVGDDFDDTDGNDSEDD